jgi:hypothetical protein
MMALSLSAAVTPSRALTSLSANSGSTVMPADPSGHTVLPSSSTAIGG